MFSCLYFICFNVYIFYDIDKERGGDRSDRGRDGGKRGREREETTSEDEVVRRLRRQQVCTYVTLCTLVRTSYFNLTLIITCSVTYYNAHRIIQIVII